ncbi:MAG TPA: ABC transporter ATP-binding protein [Terracidiphilus sp.]|nr:ABC transporter ATP-binding protein [Terracidiphilus sp.]
MTAARITVGLFDLSVAVAMYLLFLLLQGRTPAHAPAWLPRSPLSVAVLAAILVALRAFTDLYSARTVFREVQNLHKELLLRLIQGYSQIEWLRFVRSNRSELSGHAIHTTREAADFYHRCIEMTADVVIVAIMVAALVAQSPIAACGFGCALAAFYGAHRALICTKLQQAASNREQSLRVLHRDLADMLSSGKEIRTYGNHAFFYNRIGRQAERFAASNLRAVFLPQIARIAADQGAVLLFLAIIVAVQLRQGDARQVLSLLAFYFVLSRRLLPLFSQISFIAGQMESSYENVRIVASELEECRAWRAIPLPAPIPPPGIAMQLESVSFSFDRSAQLLSNVSLLLRRGESAVLYGPSGAGKSSLLNVIAGIVLPDSGVVRVDRTRLAYVPQEIPLLDDTIRNNLLFGLADASHEDLKKALALAKLDAFIAAQSEGLETRVGDNGALFSGGQRQRLGLARAILRGGELLILDEATSALDAENEQQILENLSGSGRTVLLVTHRLHAHQFAHRIFHLEDGCLIEESISSRTEQPAEDIHLSV